MPPSHTQDHTPLGGDCIILLTFMFNHSGITQLSAGGNFLCAGLTWSLFILQIPAVNEAHSHCVSVQRFGSSNQDRSKSF